MIKIEELRKKVSEKHLMLAGIVYFLEMAIFVLIGLHVILAIAEISIAFLALKIGYSIFLMQFCQILWILGISSMVVSYFYFIDNVKNHFELSVPAIIIEITTFLFAMFSFFIFYLSASPPNPFSISAYVLIYINIILAIVIFSLNVVERVLRSQLPKNVSDVVHVFKMLQKITEF